MSKKTTKTTNLTKKKCKACNKEKTTTYFYKIDSPLFPDGMMTICRDCVRKTVDVEDIEQVILFLRQIDKPFIKSYWNEALQTNKHPLGEYIRKINSLHQIRDKTFKNSDGMSDMGKIELHTIQELENVKGEMIVYSDTLIDKWGIGYAKHEYLKMEKFEQDMRLTHEIHTPIHVDMLTQLAYMSVERDRLRQEGDWGNYARLSKTIEEMTKSAGFRPVDRQGTDEATGLKSFSQIFEEVEKRGFRKPPPLEFREDIVDAMILSLSNYYHRLVGKQILTDIPEEMKQELDAFFEEDLTPVDLEANEYEELDFSVGDDA
ncbi:hypothetical protein [Thermoactinomyces sp. DSM 45892]|uniref:hypothetical protein n=1 Tax=Thermoactinomyces sp. DSM 45892 TaxID=1882753 RepID=UPI0008986CA7|nr:hypothetical protein [Thermoactinomyces sp. DSM 45892]SDX95204.1 hypothetical protein SAMN05444416_10188 [Thermoactinomyces sp. DSM 45892]